MDEYGYRSPLYGHYGQGCVHMRINFDFRTMEGLRKFREFIERAADVVLSFGGSLSRRARGRTVARGAAAEDVRAGADGGVSRVQDAVGPGQPDESGQAVPMRCASTIRWRICAIGPPDRRRRARIGACETQFVFAADDGSFERATERCVGVGACRNTEGGVMCPSYRATGEEQHSTRGRAHLLWEMLAGALREEGFQSEAVHEALDLCLSCKACKTECPVQVDMAAYKIGVSGAAATRDGCTRCIITFLALRTSWRSWDRLRRR